MSILTWPIITLYHFALHQHFVFHFLFIYFVLVCVGVEQADVHGITKLGYGLICFMLYVRRCRIETKKKSTFMLGFETHCGLTYVHTVLFHSGENYCNCWSKRRVETNGSFQNHPDSFRDSHFMVLSQTFPYRVSTLQSLKFYLIWFSTGVQNKGMSTHLSHIFTPLWNYFLPEGW